VTTTPISSVDVQVMRLGPEHFTHRVDSYGALHVQVDANRFRLTLNMQGDDLGEQARALHQIAGKLTSIASAVALAAELDEVAS
jgi:hypothetical protein